MPTNLQRTRARGRTRPTACHPRAQVVTTSLGSRPSVHSLTLSLTHLPVCSVYSITPSAICRYFRSQSIYCGCLDGHAHNICMRCADVGAASPAFNPTSPDDSERPTSPEPGYPEYVRVIGGGDGHRSHLVRMRIRGCSESESMPPPAPQSVSTYTDRKLSCTYWIHH